METHMGEKECFGLNACLKVKLVDTDALTHLATHEHTTQVLYFGKSMTLVFIVTSIENELISFLSTVNV